MNTKPEVGGWPALQEAERGTWAYPLLLSTKVFTILQAKSLFPNPFVDRSNWPKFYNKGSLSTILILVV